MDGWSCTRYSPGSDSWTCAESCPCGAAFSRRSCSGEPDGPRTAAIRDPCGAITVRSFPTWDGGGAFSSSDPASQLTDCWSTGKKLTRTGQSVQAWETVLV